MAEFLPRVIFPDITIMNKNTREVWEATHDLVHEAMKRVREGNIDKDSQQTVILRDLYVGVAGANYMLTDPAVYTVNGKAFSRPPLESGLSFSGEWVVEGGSFELMLPRASAFVTPDRIYPLVTDPGNFTGVDPRAIENLTESISRAEFVDTFPHRGTVFSNRSSRAILERHY